MGATSVIDQAPGPVPAGAGTPQNANAPSESEWCSEPWLPPPTWWAPPQSGNS
jgi:hypothetical protein